MRACMDAALRARPPTFHKPDVSRHLRVCDCAAGCQTMGLPPASSACKYVLPDGGRVATQAERVARGVHADGFRAGSCSALYESGRPAGISCTSCSQGACFTVLPAANSCICHRWSPVLSALPASAMATTTLAPVAPPSTQEESALQLDQIVANTRRCLLRPFSFFVSWQGVVTLAFRGFPPALTGLKAQLGEHYTALPPENPGSRWPKSSLGAVKEGKRLSPEQLDKLNTICRSEKCLYMAWPAI